MTWIPKADFAQINYCLESQQERPIPGLVLVNQLAIVFLCTIGSWRQTVVIIVPGLLFQPHHSLLGFVIVFVKLGCSQSAAETAIKPHDSAPTETSLKSPARTSSGAVSIVDSAQGDLTMDSREQMRTHSCYTGLLDFDEVCLEHALWHLELL